MPVYAEAVVTVSINLMKAHFPVKSVDWEKQHVQVKLFLLKSAEMNVEVACNSLLMVDVNNAHEVHTDFKGYNQCVRAVP